MSSVFSREPISVRAYLDGEALAKRKHEYVEGRVYAMVGASNAHNRIATNGTISLGQRLRGKPCEVFNSDTKIRVQPSSGTRFYYPDFMVVCQSSPPESNFQDAPTLVAEVLSDSTRRIDEFEKRDAYTSMDSVCVYLLIEQSSPEVVLYRRGDATFTRECYEGLDVVVPLPEIDCQLPLSELYERVDFAEVNDSVAGEHEDDGMP